MNRWDRSGVAVALATVAGVLALVGSGFAGAETPPAAALVATVQVDDGQGMVDTGFGSVWIANGEKGTVERIDPSTNRVVAGIRAGVGVFGLRVGLGAVWVTNSNTNTLLRIDPTTNRIVKRIRVGSFPIGLAVTPNAVWVANHYGNPTSTVSRVDPVKNRVVKTIRLGSSSNRGPKFIAASAGSIWVGVPSLQAIVRVSTTTNKLQATIHDKGSCSGIAVASDGGVWSAGGAGPGCAAVVTHVDPARNALVGRKLTVEGGVADVAFGAASVWYTAIAGHLVGRIDSATGALTSTVEVPGTPTGITFGFGSVWVIDRDHSSLLRLNPAGATP